MNYQSMKFMVETLIKTFKCPSCNSLVNEEDIDIIGAAGNTVNIDIECKKCKKHSMIKSEINTITPMNLDLGKKLQNLNNKNLQITDKQIVNLNKKLKGKNLNAKDLFDDEKQ